MLDLEIHHQLAVSELTLVSVSSVSVHTLSDLAPLDQDPFALILVHIRRLLPLLHRPYVVIVV
jgi:hypothetical protein